MGLWVTGSVLLIYAIAQGSLKKIQDFNGIWTRDLAITGAMLYQLSYEATDVGSRSIVGSYVPVKEMSVIAIWNKSYMNCGNEMKMKMKKWSSQWTQFIQLRREAWKKVGFDANHPGHRM